MICHRIIHSYVNALAFSLPCNDIGDDARHSPCQATRVLLCLWTDPTSLLSFRRTMCDANDVIHATPVAMRDIPRRKGTRADLILQDGPPTLCVIIGTPQGRWHAEFQSLTPEAAHCRRLLCQALNVQDLAERTCESSTMLGIAVMTGWHVVTSSVTNEHSRTFNASFECVSPTTKAN